MLARIEDGLKHLVAPIAPFEVPEPQRKHGGFPLWRAFFVEPNREGKAANWLARMQVQAYLPQFSKRVRRARGRCIYRLHAVMPGMLFVPEEMLGIDRFDEILEWGHVRGAMRTAGNVPYRLTKADIERIRVIEGKLNMPDAPVDGRGIKIDKGQKVRFLDPANDAMFGEGVVFEVAGFTRIGVETRRLFGGGVKIFVPSSEIEVM